MKLLSKISNCLTKIEELPMEFDLLNKSNIFFLNELSKYNLLLFNDN